jgi:hypothetical protein
MMNSASIATGTYPGVHGFYGNVVYAPLARGKNAKGVDLDFSAPAFIEDFGVVEAVRESYQGKLTLVLTMLQAAQAKGLTTAAVGKFGAAFIQDYKRGGIILDEDAAMPLGFAKELQQAGYPLPRNSGNAYEAGALTLANNNGDPTAPIPIRRLMDGQTANPLDRTGALSRRGFAYLTEVFVNYILPNKKPDLTIFWSKEPDATSHAYGPGTYNSIDATKMNDEILGRVVDKLRQLGWEQSTDIIITQDHNHSTVSGDVAHYPLRAIVDRGVGSHDPHGYSVSGFVRTAETYRFCRVSWSMARTFSPARMTSTATFAVGRKNTPHQPMWSRSRFLLGRSSWPRMRAATIYSSRMAISTLSRPPWRACRAACNLARSS